jgi:parvulin-like peptidyl-prolyl isomerase
MSSMTLLSRLKSSPACCMFAVMALGALACGEKPAPDGAASNPVAAAEPTESKDPADAPLTPEMALEPIAKVNGVTVPRVLYVQTLTYIRSRIPEGNVERYLNAKFDAMQLIINDELLYQEAKRLGLEASDAAVEGALQDAASRAGGEKAFLAGMESQGFDRNFVKETIRKRQTIDRFVQEHLLKEIEVTEAEELEYYNRNLERFTPETWVHVQRILVRIPPKADAADVAVARKRADSILSLLRRGEKFETMAHEYSEDQVASLGGDLGFIKRGVASPQFDAVAFNLRPGETSDVVEDDTGFHIIRLIEKRGGEPAPFAEVKEACRERVLANKKDLMIRGTANRLREAATVETYEQ